MSTPLLKWTGHPLADVGVATLCAMVNKTEPADLTAADLETCGREIAAAYVDRVFVAYLSCVYSMNSPYTNPTIGEGARRRGIERVLFPLSHPPDPGANGFLCVFSGEPATHLLNRQDVPMLTAAGVLNFFPAGLSEMPVAAPYVLAIQALALGGRRSEGKLLIVHCDDPRWTLHFARNYLQRNRAIINLARTNQLPSIDDPENVLTREMPGGLNAEKRPKYPDAKAPKSLVMSDLLEVVVDRTRGDLAESHTSVTVYMLSNSGQGPSLSIEQIPGEFVTFLLQLHSSANAAKWQRLVDRAWRGAQTETVADAEPAKGRKAKKPAKAAPTGPGRSHNSLYNDLLDVFEHGFINWHAAARFIRRHLLCSASNYYFDLSKSPNFPPRFNYDDLTLIDWELASLFLIKVLGMTPERIRLIKDFATKMAELINTHNDKQLFRQLVYTAGEFQYRAVLAKVQHQYAKDRNKLALSFDEYVDVFLNAAPEERASWSLIRDLISIRIVECLFEEKFFDRGTNREVLEEPEASAA